MPVDALLARIQSEFEYNASKGTSAYPSDSTTRWPAS